MPALTYKVMNEVLDEMSNDGVCHCHHHQGCHEEVEDGLGQRNGVSRRGFILLVKLVIVRVRVLEQVVQASREVAGVHGLAVGQVVVLLGVLEDTYHRAGGGFHLLYQVESLVNAGEDLGEESAPIFDGTDVANNHNCNEERGLQAQDI